MAPTVTGAAKTAAGGSSVRGRTKHEQDQLQRKTVYRPVLDNPLVVAWPPLPASIRKTILDQLVPILSAPQGPQKQSVTDWRAQEHAARRHRVVGDANGKGKGKGRRMKDAKVNKGKGKQVVHEEDAAVPMQMEETGPPKKKVRLSTGGSAQLAASPTDRGSRATTSSRPQLLEYLSLGINEVTKALESRIRWGRWELGDDKARPGSAQLRSPPPHAPSEPTSDPLIPTAVDNSPLDMSGEDSKRKSRKRLRKKSNPTAFAPSTTLKLESIDYSSLPGYEFLASPTTSTTVSSRRRPSVDQVETPPYYLAPTESNPAPRLLVNSESLRIKRAIKKKKESELSGNEKESFGKEGKKRTRGKNVGEKRAVPEAVPVDSEGNQQDHKTQNENTAQEEEEKEEKTESATVPLIDLVFVCKPDINPPSLVAHLPGMVAAANGVQVALDTIHSTSQPDGKDRQDGMEIDSKGENVGRPEFGKVRLVPLDQGAERVLADALGLRRVACIGLSSSTPGAEELLALVAKHLSPPLAPWLTPHLLHPPPISSSSSSNEPDSRYVETHIKHLKTSAPLNPRAAHQEKKEKRKVVKAERRKKAKAIEGEKEGNEVYEARDDDDEN